MAMARSKSVDPDLSSTPPKLSLYSLPSQRRQPSGMATPPLRVPVSVPFSWEEAPGKPRNKEPRLRDPRTSPSPGWHRGLDLPPRMVVEEMRSNNNVQSSTTGLDGPFVLGRAATCSSFSWGENPVKSKEGGVWFWRREKGRKVRRDRNWERSFRGLRGFISPSLSSSSQSSATSSVGDGTIGNEEEEEEEGEEAKHDRKVRITRFRRTKSVASVSSYATSHLWAGIYGSLKQFVPWRKERAIGGHDS